MATRIGIIVGCLVWGLGSMPRAADEGLSLAPQQGVLVLRSGRVVRGEISRVGDRYRVVLGGQDEVGVPVDSVVLQAATLTDAYHLRAQQLGPRATAADHLTLADWCVRCELWEEAAQELDAARSLDPEAPAAQAFERRLRLAMRPASPKSHSPPPTGTTPPGPIDREPSCRHLPPGTVEAFTNQVQPLLINRCGTSGCHGPRCQSAFQLEYPSDSRALPQPVTQRNLQAALRYVDRQRPDASILLDRATTPHGNRARAALSARDRNQLAHLVNWLQMMAEPGAAGASSPPSGPVPSGPVVAPAAAARRLTARPAPARLTKSGAARPPTAAGSKATAEATADATAAVEDRASGAVADPFDPAVFNRRYLPPAQ